MVVTEERQGSFLEVFADPEVNGMPAELAEIDQALQKAGLAERVAEQMRGRWPKSARKGRKSLAGGVVVAPDAAAELRSGHREGLQALIGSGEQLDQPVDGPSGQRGPLGAWHASAKRSRVWQTVRRSSSTRPSSQSIRGSE